MAMVDLKTGKIIDCKKYSRVWWHEKGHIAFSKTYKGFKYPYYQSFMQMITIFLLCLNLVWSPLLLKIYTLLCGAMVIYYYIYEEVYSWIYSFSHYNPNLDKR